MQCRRICIGGLAMLFLGMLLGAIGSPASGAVTEPNLDLAKLWWTELPKKWTAVGWNEHITRFNVLHDGTILNFFSFDKGAQNPLAIRPPIPEPLRAHMRFRGLDSATWAGL